MSRLIIGELARRLAICRNDPTILIRLVELASGDEPRVDDTDHSGAAPEAAAVY